jgi:voltage-gated potassium channel
MTVSPTPPERSQHGPAAYEALPRAWQRPWINLERELRQPTQTWAKRYTAGVLLTILAGMLYLFIADEYPNWMPLQSVPSLFGVSLLAVVFAVDFLLNAMTTRLRDWRAQLWLLVDLGALVPAVMVLAWHAGWAHELDGLMLLRLFRFFRVLKLLRLSRALSDVLGTSVLSMVFGTMMAHLALRVSVTELNELTHIDAWAYIDRNVLLPGVQAVGAALGIALSITFGIVKRKQMEITELHRSAVDAVNMFEHTIHTALADVAKTQPPIDFDGWRRRMALFLQERVGYDDIKTESMDLLKRIYDIITHRPPLESPFHGVLVQKLSQFLTRTQVGFHPVFYTWLRRVAQVYFISLMWVSPGLTGLAVQMLVIFVFAGLIAIIDDMDHATERKWVVFNAKILRV